MNILFKYQILNNYILTNVEKIIDHSNIDHPQYGYILMSYSICTEQNNKKYQWCFPASTLDVSNHLTFETLEEAILYCTLHNIKYYDSEILDKLSTARMFSDQIWILPYNLKIKYLVRTFLKNAEFKLSEFKALTN